MLRCGSLKIRLLWLSHQCSSILRIWGMRVFNKIFRKCKNDWILWKNSDNVKHQRKEVKVSVTQLCPTLCDPMDCSPPGSSVHGDSPGKNPEWVAMPSSRESSQPRDQTQVFIIVGGFFTVWATREAPKHQRRDLVNAESNSVIMETEKADENKQLERETKEKHDKIHKIELITNMEEHNIFMCYNYQKDNPLFLV